MISPTPSEPATTPARRFPFLLLLAWAGAFSHLPAQTVVPLYTVTGGTTVTVLSTSLVATGSNTLPTIAGTTPRHRDALIVTGGATLSLAAGANVAVKNADDNYDLANVEDLTSPTDPNNFKVITRFMRIGYGNGDSGTLLIGTGATLAVGHASRYANFHVAEGQGATGTVQQSGGLFTVMGSFNVGVNGGTGVYNLSGGSLVIDHDDVPGYNESLATIGFNKLTPGPGADAASSGIVNVSGGLLTVTAHEWSPGHYGSVELVIGNRVAGAGVGNGTLNQTGGVVHVDSPATLYLSAYGNGTYNLNGGTLEIGGNSLQAKSGSGPGTATFNLGGGTIKVIGRNLTTSVDATLTALTQSVLDTNGFNATWGGAFTGSGGFTKRGAGTLTLSGASRSFGFFNAAQGTTVQTAGVTTSPEFTVGSGTGANGTFTLSGGSIVIDGFPPFPGGTPVGTSSGLRVGDFGGTGVFNQTAGTIVIGSATNGGSLNIGNQGGNGTYNLSGGTLTLAQGVHNLGRNRNADITTTSHGTLNLSGTGVLEVVAGTSLILGDRDSFGLSGTGTVTQTGGTLRLTNGSLYLSAYGNGTYNLNGGTLEAGGSTSVLTNYAGAGTYAFNLGGGRIKVIGSDLTLATNATLTGTTSTFDTNGLAATWSGNLTGAGGLTKTGAGTLTLSGTNTYGGTTYVNQGTLRLGTAGALSPFTALSVATGASFDTNGFVQTFTTLSGSGDVNVGSSGLLLTPTDTTTPSVYTGTISGPGGLTLNGTGTLVLAGTNDFTGATTISQGTIKLGAEGALPANTAVSLGATAKLDLDGHAATVGQLAGAGQVDLGTASLTISQGTSSTFSGGISGSGSLVKSGTGVLTLSGANNFSGPTAINEGTIKLGAAGALPTGTVVSLGQGAKLDLDGHAATVSQLTGAGEVKLGTVATASLTVSPVESTTFAGVISGAGSLIKSGTGELTLTGSNNFSGGTTVSEGTIKLGAAGALPTGTAVTLGATATLNLDGHDATLGQLAGAGQVALGDNGSLVINQSTATTTFSGGISGTGELVKTGTGLLVLSGNNNDFTGTTSIGGGELKITGSAAHSDFTVTGGTLSGTGTIANLTLGSGGTLAPGNSPGTLTAVNTTWEGGGTYDWEINNGTGIAGTNWDLLSLSGTLTITATPTNRFSLSVISLLPGNNTAGNVINFDDTRDQSYTLVTTVGGIIGFNANAFSLDTSAFTNSYAGSWTFASNGYKLSLNFTPVPEPGEWALLLTGLSLLAAMRSRRRR